MEKFCIVEWAACIATSDYKRKYLEGKKLVKAILFAKFANFSDSKIFPHMVYWIVIL